MRKDSDPFLPAPDPTFFISPQERAEMFVAFDPDVVEKILRWVRPDERDSFRRTFFVELEYQNQIERGIIVGSERPELADLIAQLGRAWD
jgi:hypothetical protein